jgi:diacylglycerol O-acyltransferase
MKRLGGLDAAMLEVEKGGLPVHATAMLTLDPSTVPGGYSFERMFEFIGARLALVPPLRRRLVEVPFGIGRPVWVEASVALDEHVHRSAVARPGGPRELAAYASRVHEETLPRDRPLWQMHVVEGLADGRIAIVAKVHHALMDGVAGMQFMAAFFSTEPDAEQLTCEPPQPERVPGGAELLARSLPEIATRPVRAAAVIGQTLIGAGRVAERIPRMHLRSQDRVLPAPHVPWSAPLTSRRSAAYTTLPFDEVHRVAKNGDVTVNDVVLATFGGALRRYLDARGALPGRSLVAAVPVSVRDNGATGANAVSLIFVTLGTDVADPGRRLALVHLHARGARELHDAFGGTELLSWTDVFAPMAFALGARVVFESKLLTRLPLLCNAVVSNVPGPPLTLYFGGARLEGLFPLGPIVDGIAINLTVVSSHDTIGFGLVSCPDLVDDLWAITREIEREHAQYAGLQPW